MYKDFDVCENYGIDEYLTSVSLVVSAKYRGRGIGEQLLDTRKVVCQEFGIRLTSTSFTSDHSNRIAEKVGFKIDRILRCVQKRIVFECEFLFFLTQKSFDFSYDEIRKTHPHLNLPPIKSEALTIMSKEY